MIKNKHGVKESVVFFRRYCRKGYSVFNSLHRVVNISRLATYIADRQMFKSLCTMMMLSVLMPLPLQAQEEEDTTAEIGLRTVHIVAPTAATAGPAALVVTAEEMGRHSLRSVSDILTFVAGIDIRVRGVNDVQGDVSFRGGTFDQMVVLLNGINLTDPQTGHHALDLPIDIAMVDKVEVLTPSQLLERGVVAYCGGVNIVVDEDYKNRLLAEVKYGSHGTVKAAVRAAVPTGRWRHSVAATYAHSDGYMPNTDYDMGNLFVHSSTRGRSGEWKVDVGGQMKNFGSQAFYSIAYPDQYEATRSMTASLTHLVRSGKVTVESALYGRLHSDRFELFREGVVSAPSWYKGHNYHLSDIAGVKSRMMMPVGRGLMTAGVDLRHEGIVSSVLGVADSEGLCKPPSKYSRSASRTGGSLFGGYSAQRGRARFGVNGLVNISDTYGMNYGASGSVEIGVVEGLTAGCSLSRSYRNPTFTDLYYEGVNQRSNPELVSERNAVGEVNVRYRKGIVDVGTSVYYRVGRGTIDWVRRNETEMWQSMNHSRVSAFGAEFSASVRPRGVLESAGAVYAYCNTLHDAGEMLSSSVFDILRHKLNVNVVLNPLSWMRGVESPLRLKLDGRLTCRDGVYENAEGAMVAYGSVVIFNASVEYRLKRVVTSLEMYNIGGVEYYDFGGVPQPGRMVMVGVRYGLQEGR